MLCGALKQADRLRGVVVMRVVVRRIRVTGSIRQRRVLLTIGGVNCLRLSLELAVIVLVIIAAGMGMMRMVVAVIAVGKMIM
jgi:hypothetical protein